MNLTRTLGGRKEMCYGKWGRPVGVGKEEEKVGCASKRLIKMTASMQLTAKRSMQEPELKKGNQRSLRKRLRGEH